MVLLSYPNGPKLIHIDFEAKGQLYHVGARIEALFKGVLIEVSDLGNELEDWIGGSEDPGSRSFLRILIWI